MKISNSVSRRGNVTYLRIAEYASCIHQLIYKLLCTNHVSCLLEKQNRVFGNHQNVSFLFCKIFCLHFVYKLQLCICLYNVSCLFTFHVKKVSCLFTLLYLCQLFVYIIAAMSANCLHFIKSKLFVYIIAIMSVVCLYKCSIASYLFTFQKK